MEEPAFHVLKNGQGEPLPVYREDRGKPSGPRFGEFRAYYFLKDETHLDQGDGPETDPEYPERFTDSAGNVYTRVPD